MKNLFLRNSRTTRIPLEGVSSISISERGFLAGNGSSITELPYKNSTKPGTEILRTNSPVIESCPLPLTGEYFIVLENGEFYRGLELVGEFPQGILSAKFSWDSRFLALVTTDNLLQVMDLDDDYSIIFDLNLSTVDLNTSSHVSIGWGKKETQFHGSAGKAAALSQNVIAPGISKEDTKCIAISWRQDCAYFGVNFISTFNGEELRRILVIDVQNRKLASISEALTGLEETLAWKLDEPSSIFMASTQLVNNKRNVVFIERNGLKHREFPLRRDIYVCKMSWSKCGTVLSMFFIDGVIQLWTTKNYHWYLKAEFSVSFKNILEVAWEDNLKLHVVTDAEEYEYQFMVLFSTTITKSPKYSLVGVIDGTSLLLTPFAVTNIPPPLCHFKVEFDKVPKYFLIFEQVETILLQVSFEEELVYVRINPSDWSWKIIEKPPDEFDSSSVETLVGNDCNHCDKVAGMEFFLNSGNDLFANGDLIYKGCTSFITTPEFVIFTNLEQKLYFWLLDEVKKSNTFEELKNKSTEDTVRSVEKGAEIVAFNGNECSLVLQMPRGNLEFIYPRPFIFNRIRELLGKLDYRLAYNTMRRHRIDLNTFVDWNPAVFISTLKNFVEQVNESSYLNLFITELREGNLAHQKYSFAKHEYNFKDGKVNTVCNAISVLLDNTKHYESLIACYACMNPPNIRKVLEIIVSFKDTAVIEHVINYASFLVKLEKLYDEALSIYNLSLALSLAKRSSNMNPQDYLPFLNKMASLPVLEQQFQICEYLKNHKESIRVLLKMYDSCEPDKSDLMNRIVEYIVERKLFKEGIEICSGKIRDTILVEYAKSLSINSSVKSLLLAKEFEKAKKLITKDNWRLLYRELSKDELLPLKNESIEIAAQLEDIETAVSLALKEEKYTWALRHSQGDISTELKAATTDMLLRISDNWEELKSKFDRLLPLQTKFIADPISFISASMGINPSPSDNETASQMSFVSRQSALSSSSKRSKKKQERNKLKDKPGSPFEREFLHHTITNAINNFKDLAEPIFDLKEALELNDSLEMAKQLSQAWEKVLYGLKGYKDKYESLLQRQFTKQSEDVFEVRTLLQDYVKMRIDFPEFQELSSEFY